MVRGLVIPCSLFCSNLRFLTPPYVDKNVIFYQFSPDMGVNKKMARACDGPAERRKFFIFEPTTKGL